MTQQMTSADAEWAMRAEPTFATVHVDAATAARWLAHHNSHNRKIVQTRVDAWAREMTASRWVFNGEAIQFDWNGVLLNGQHRLLAIVKTGLTQKFLIVRGLDPDAQFTLDQGTRRDPASQLNLNDNIKVTVSATVAAAIRHYLRWTTGKMFGDMVAVENRVSTGDVVEWAQANPEQVQLMANLDRTALRRLFRHPSLTIAIAFRLHQIDDAAATRFFGLLAAPNLPADSPVLALRERMWNMKDRHEKALDRDVVALFVVAWNAYRDGRVMTKLQRPRGRAWTRTNFPEPH